MTGPTTPKATPRARRATGSTRAGRPAAPPALTADDLAKVFGLLKGADTAELKVSVPSPAQRSTITGLPIDPVEAQPRQVFFFDTPDLALNKAGIVVRARRVQGGRGDTVVKLRPVVPAELPKELRLSGALTVEVDVVPGGFVCSASFKGRTTGEDIAAAVTGQIPLRKIFSKEQRAFFAERAPAGIDLDSLSILGPTFILKTTFTPDELRRRIVAEMWLYPDGSRILELSTKCLPNEAFQVAAEARAYLASRGIKVGSGQQQTKTRAALDFYVKELRKAAAPTRGRRRGDASRSTTTRSTTTRARQSTAPTPAVRPRTGPTTPS